MLRASYLALLASASAYDKVKVDFFSEAGWPFCRDTVSGPVKTLLDAEGLIDILDFNYSPFGNNYYITSECGGSSRYDASIRGCFNDACGRDSTSRADDCFTGEIVPQHGPTEAYANRYMACAKRDAAGDVLKFMDYVYCIEEGYDSFSDAFASQCASSSGFDGASIKACYDGEDGDSLTAAEAAATPAHAGVPYLELNGAEVQNTDLLLQSVCRAYEGPAPAGCATVASRRCKRPQVTV